MPRSSRLPLIWLTVPLLLLMSAPAAAQDSATAGADSVATVLQEVADIQSRISYLEGRYETAEGEDRELFEDQLHRRWRDHHRLLGRAVEATEAAREAGSEDSAQTAAVRKALAAEVAFLVERGERLDEQIHDLRVARPDTPPSGLFALEVELTRLNTSLDGLIAMATDDIEWADVVGLDLGPAVAGFDQRLEERAATTAARIELTMDRQSQLESVLGVAGADSAQIREELQALDEKLRGTTATLQATVEQLNRRDLSTTRYRQLLLDATGELSTEILDPEVVGGLIEERWTELREWFDANGGRILVRTVGILLVLILFGLVARFARRLVSRLLSASRLQTTELLKRLLTGVASKLVWLIGILIALSMIGVDVGPMLAGLGIAGFVLGFALQDTLSNFAAGMMIMFYHPFDVGDVVTAGGVTGKVEAVSLVSTVILTFDNQVIVVPNNKVWGDVITNVTAQRTRRVDLKFGIGYADDIPKAQSIMEDVLSSHELVLSEPEPVVRVFELGDSSVNFVCRPWCKTEDYWAVYFDITESVKRRFDEEGITIPFPQRDVHLHRGDVSEV